MPPECGLLFQCDNHLCTIVHECSKEARTDRKKHNVRRAHQQEIGKAPNVVHDVYQVLLKDCMPCNRTTLA